MTAVEVRAADGALAIVHTHGAHVTSWMPAPGADEQLFLSGRSSYGEGASIRGGIPVIFPQFAAEGPLPRHGFARTAEWSLASKEVDAAGRAVASFTLGDSPATRAIWPHAFQAALEVRVHGLSLEVELSIENTGDAPFDFAAALHTYLRVHRVHETELVGLHGARYRVSSEPDTLRFDDAESVRIIGEIDRVYVGAPRRIVLREPGRHLDVEMIEFPDVVVWNPGAERAAGMADMEPGGEANMLCVEAGAVQERVTLDAGRRWTGTQRLTVRPVEP